MRRIRSVSMVLSPAAFSLTRRAASRTTGATTLTVQSDRMMRELLDHAGRDTAVMDTALPDKVGGT
jgi:hypothetical protein